MSSDKLPLKVGARMVFSAPVGATLLLILKAQPDAHQLLQCESLSLTPELPIGASEDLFGNTVHKVQLPAGRTTIEYDALVEVANKPEAVDLSVPLPDVAELSYELLRYTLPSRYCDSDKLLDMAAAHFETHERNLGMVQAISDWVHANIEYRYGACDPLRSASEAIANRYGVCRDFAHIGIALCRAMNIPARYASGFLPQIGVPPNPAPMDFHAYVEVYAAGRWHTFDPRYNVPRIGRVRVAAGLDAVDAAFATTFGEATMEYFEVWSH